MSGPPAPRALLASHCGVPEDGPGLPWLLPRQRGGAVALVERLKALHEKHQHMLSWHGREEEIAEEVFRNAITRDNVTSSFLRVEQHPASRVSGDLYVCAYTPQGELYVLLGDFTGHGPSAALGALPATDTFRAMTNKGFPPDRILEAINHKLCNLLPTGMFMAAQFVALDRSTSVHWLAQYIEHSSKCAFTNRYGNRLTCVDHFHSANHSIGTA